MQDHDQQLRNSWAQFCDSLKASGEIIFRETGPQSPNSKASGLRLLARNVSLAMQFEMENANPDFPELLHYFDPLRKQGGDNTDALYVGAPINGQHSYRLHGNKGSAAFFAVTVLENGDTPWGGQVVATLLGKDLAVDEAGNFELFISPQPKPADFKGDGKNWIQSSAKTYRITFRQFFADWANEQPMQAEIECLSHNATHPVFEPEHLQHGLQQSAHWIHWSVSYWADMIDHWKQQPNTFMSYGELEKNKIDFTPGGAPIIAYWQLPKDEVILVRVVPPKADYWAVEFGNYWWETMDYRYHLSNTNCHFAVLEDNGELCVLISHDDLGADNWLDPSGHEEGYITYRWIGAESYPKPSCEQMSVLDLKARYPQLLDRIDGEQRRQQIRQRRQGVVRRFGT